MTTVNTAPPVMPAWWRNPAPAPDVFGVIPTPRTGQFSAPTTGRAPRRFVVPVKAVKVILLAACGVLAAMVVFGLGIGAGRSQASHTPDPTTLGVLSFAQSHAATGETCYAVWSQGDSAWSVKCGQLR
jgi:hypothetical protein